MLVVHFFVSLFYTFGLPMIPGSKSEFLPATFNSTIEYLENQNGKKFRGITIFGKENWTEKRNLDLFEDKVLNNLIKDETHLKQYVLCNKVRSQTMASHLHKSFDGPNPSIFISLEYGDLDFIRKTYPKRNTWRTVP